MAPKIQLLELQQLLLLLLLLLLGVPGCGSCEPLLLLVKKNLLLRLEMQQLGLRLHDLTLDIY